MGNNQLQSESLWKKPLVLQIISKLVILCYQYRYIRTSHTLSKSSTGQCCHPYFTDEETQADDGPGSLPASADFQLNSVWEALAEDGRQEKGEARIFPLPSLLCVFASRWATIHAFLADPELRGPVIQPPWEQCFLLISSYSPYP